MVSSENLKQLHAEFDTSDVHWRAQSVTRNGDKAMALAYIDARHVMERLDQIVGSENWQDNYEVFGGKTICYLSIRVGDEWITKADGAGDTAVEAEKGSISDAFKRAAVKWGIGRYLYDMPTPWVPCECYELNGKKKFSKFTADPWNFVKPTSAASQKRIWNAMETEIGNVLNDAESLNDCRDIYTEYWRQLGLNQMQTDEWKSCLLNLIGPTKEKFEQRGAAE